MGRMLTGCPKIPASRVASTYSRTIGLVARCGLVGCVLLNRLDHRRIGGGTVNARLPLQPSNIGDDLDHQVLDHAFDWWHVTKFPVMGSDTLHRCGKEGLIPMMVGIVDVRKKRRSLVGSRPIRATTDGEVGIEYGFTILKFGWRDS